MRIRDLLYTLAILICGTALSSAQFIINPYSFAAGGVTPVSPGTGSLIAWYDFADATDADGGTYNLAGTNSPTYTAGPPSYGASTNGTPAAYWQQTTFPNTFVATDGDWSFVIRWRALSGIVNGDRIYRANGGRSLVEYDTGTGIEGCVGTSTPVSSGVIPTTGVWYTTVLTRSTTTNIVRISVNGSAFADSAATTDSNAAGSATFGASSTSDSHPVEIDFAAFYNKELTAENVAWLYNSDATRLYSEL
jgi:hypothetical protein